MDKGQLKCYVFRRSNTMEWHNFTDDVAMTYAWSKEQAIKRFGKLYGDVKEDEVIVPWFNNDKVAILTDY